MKLSTLNLYDLFALELFLVELYSALIFVEYLLILIVFVLFLAQLISVVLAHSEHLALIAEVETVLKPGRDAHYLVLTQRLDQLRLFAMNVIAGTQLALK